MKVSTTSLIVYSSQIQTNATEKDSSVHKTKLPFITYLFYNEVQDLAGNIDFLYKISHRQIFGNVLILLRR